MEARQGRLMRNHMDEFESTIIVGDIDAFFLALEKGVFAAQW